MTVPTLHLVEDVPATLAAIAVASQRRLGRLRYASSGAAGGRACIEALVASPLDWSSVDLFLVDERCVGTDSVDRNDRMIAEALGDHLDELAGFHPMDCNAGPASYEEELRATGRLDLVQLGVGPDGHTASLFPASPALSASETRFVTRNEDPAGNNAHERMTLTFSGIAHARLAVVTVFGAAKHDILTRLVEGEDLPAAHVSAQKLAWLVDAAAAGDLPTAPLPADLVPGGTP